MSRTGKFAILGTVAASAMLVGAMQFALGHDLGPAVPEARRDQLGTLKDNVNRVAKADREALLAEATPTRTVSIKLAAFADTSFLLRLPLTNTGAQTGRNEPPQGTQLISTEGERREAKRTIACEPSVSILTEIAKRLQPGRCVT